MIGALVLVLLVAHACAHVALAAGLWRGASPGRAALAFFVAPLAPYWGFERGLRRRAWAWIATLAAYAVAAGIVRGCV